MAATATAPNGMSNPNNRSNLAQAFVELASDLLPFTKSSSSLGATTNAQSSSLGGVGGGLSEADRTKIAVVAGLTGKHAKAIDDHMQQAAELGARAAKEAGHKGPLTEEQAKAISEQVMKSLDGKHLGAQVQEKTRFGKSKAAFIGTLGAASALTAGALALAAKPLAWAGDKIMGTKVSESFSVRGALTKGFLAVAVTFGAAAAYDMHKRNSRNNARQEALVHAIQKGAQSHAQGRFVTRAEAAAAAAAKQEPTLAPDAPKADQAQAQATGAVDTASLSSAEKAKQMTTLMSTASSPTAPVTSPAPKPPAVDTATAGQSSADKAKNMTALMSTSSSPTATAIPPAPKPLTAAAPVPPAPKPAAPAPAGPVQFVDRKEVLGNMMKAVAAAKPASISGGETVASGPVGPGKLPDAPAPKVEATRG